MKKVLTKLKILLLVTCGIFISFSAYAQQMVSGTVTDAVTGEGLIGATVQVKGTTKGTVTDLSGNYSIEVNSQEDVLVFSYIGYETTEQMVGERTEISVSLSESATQLEDVVVIGYGTVKKSDLTGSVAVVNSEDLNRTPAANFQKALQGKAPGVLVSSTSGAPGSGASIKVRGIGSINRDANPIYVIDGIFTGSLNSINPADIESMQVLKDASAAAIYGADGANGVIIITTKRGQSGATRVSYNSYYSINRIPKKLELMNADQYADFYNTLNERDGITEPAYTDAFRQFYYGDGWQQGTDWQDAVTQTGYRHNQYIRISGGGENSNFSISGNFFDEKGIVINTGAKRYNFRANSDFTIGDRLRIGETFNISRLVTQNGGGVFGGANIATPLMRIYNPDNKEGFEGPQIALLYDVDPNDTIINSVPNTGGNDKPNPVGQGSLTDDFSYNTSILGNLYAEYDLFDWLVYRASASVTMGHGKLRQWTPSYDMGVRSMGIATLREDYNENIGLQLENQLTFNKTFGDHGITATAVHQVRKSDGTSIRVDGSDFAYEYIYTMTNANQDKVSARGSINPFRMISYLGRVIYDYQNKLLFTGSFRRDGVSRFGPENRWGNFPSASVAYKINEDFFQNVEQLNMLKVRVGWGSTGNSNIGSFGYDDFLSPGFEFSPVFGIPNVTFPGTYIWRSFANPLIRWESAEMFNAGIDVNAFNNRLQASVEYYVKNQNDLLVKKDVSVAFGRATRDDGPFANIGKNRNSGWEIQLSYRDFEGDFKYSTSVNFTSVKNEVISLPVKNIIEGNNITLVGHTIGSLYGYVSEGILTKDDFEQDEAGNLLVDEKGNYLYKHAMPSTGVPEPGDLKFKDINNDGVITNLDRTIIGKPLPDYLVGWNFECSWKNFDFSLFLNSMINYQVFNQQRSTLESFIGQDLDHNKLLAFAENYYTLDDPSTDYLRADRGNSNDNTRISTWWVEEASFVRVRDIQLGYNIPSALLNNVGINSTRLYVSAENPLIFTKYKGRDPENAAFNNPTTSGTDGGGFPNPRIITFGVQVDF